MMNSIKMSKIPKVIHYCWFGKQKLSDEVLKCIDSWKRKCPDYEIIRWSEDNYDITNNRYIKQAYEQKKWSFVTDYVRLDVIYKYGGIYLDVDVELIKNLDDLLEYDAFFGFENKDYIATGLGFGAVPKQTIIKDMRDMYNELKFVNNDNSLNQITCPIYNTEIIRKYGFIINGRTQMKNNVCIFSPEYFAPYDYITTQINITNNTYSIHWYNMSWKSIGEKRNIRIIQNIYKKNKILGWMYEYIYYFFKYIREKGLIFTLKKVMNKVKKNEN